MPRNRKSINIEIGQRIKERRTSLGMTRDELAHLSGYSIDFMAAVERGVSGLSAESFRAVSLALDSSVDYFIFGESNPEFDAISKKLSLVPEDKLKYVLRIIDDVISCTQ